MQASSYHVRDYFPLSIHLKKEVNHRRKAKELHLLGQPLVSANINTIVLVFADTRSRDLRKMLIQYQLEFLVYLYFISNTIVVLPPLVSV